MCGRYTLKTPASVLAETFDLDELPDLAPRYNIAPTQEVVVVRREADDPARRLRMLRWGLIPSWAKDPAIGNRMINARSETAATKPSFRSALRKRRCLVLADGFYEWRKEGGGKQPWHIRMKDGSPFGIAGLWEHWTSPEGEAVESCTLLTTGPNEVLVRIHDRMPVILPRESHELWLDPGPRAAEELQPLLEAYPGEAFEAFPVSRSVNRPAHDGPDCMEPLAGWDGSLPPAG